MTESQQNETMGRALTDRAAAKRNATVLRYRIMEFQRNMGVLEKRLDEFLAYPGGDLSDEVKVLVAKLPSPDRVSSDVDELVTESRRLELLESLIARF